MGTERHSERHDERDAGRAGRDAERESRRGDRGERGEHEHGDEWGGRRGGRYGRRAGGFEDGFPPPFPPMPPMPPFGGPGGFFGPEGLFGPGGIFGPGGVFGGPSAHRGRGRGRGPGRSRAGRGDVRVAILLLLDEEPANGYQIMQEIEQRSGGIWKPSSGSVYPALQQLEDEGLVETVEVEGRRVFGLTEAGRAYVAERRDQLTAPWDNVPPAEEPSDEAVRMRDVVSQLAMAYVQVVQVGTESQRAEAARVLTGARQALYRILADGASEE